MPPPDRLLRLTRAACEDALFATLGTGTGSRALEGVARRRAPAYDTLARGEGAITLEAGEAWRLELVRAMAPIGVPWFVPMRDAIDDGLSLEHEPRGLRALIPIGAASAQERVRREGAFAVRVARVVAASDGPLGPDEKASIDLLLAALALPAELARTLRDEPPTGAVASTNAPNAMNGMSAIEPPADLEPRMARAILAGAWQVAAVDGVDPAERAAVVALAIALGFDEALVSTLAAASERASQAQLSTGLASIDAIRYVVAPLAQSDDRALSSLLAATVHLSVPPLHRAEALAAIASGAATPLGRAHDVDKVGRATALLAAWGAAMSIDPTLTSRARLAARHDRVATDLGSERAGREARDVMDSHLEKILARGVALAGG